MVDGTREPGGAPPGGHTGDGRSVAERFRSIVAETDEGIVILEPDGTISYANAAAEFLLGYAREELVGGDLWKLFPAAVGSDFETHFRGAVDSSLASVPAGRGNC